MGGRLAGKVALVTGASKGIGRAIALCFAREGARVALTARHPEGLAAVARQIESGGGTALPMVADAGSEADTQRAVAATHERFGGPDILVANAFAFTIAPIEAISSAEWDHVLGVNLKGLFLATRLCIPHMKRQRSGRIIAISSVTGPRVALPSVASYAASKGGINAFVRAAALELGPSGITVNAIEPGTVDTEGLRTAFSQAEIDTIGADTPLKRVGAPEDIALVALFFASDDSRFVTGQMLAVDGGKTLPEDRTAFPA